MDTAAFFQQHCAQDRGDDSLHLPRWRVDDWRQLLARATAVSVRKGDVLIRHGERERALYFVAVGALEVTLGTAGVDALGPLSRERPGAVLGEVSLFDGQPRTATVWAVEPTQLLRLDIGDLEAFAVAHPTLAYDLLFALGRVLAFRLRRRERIDRGGR